MTKTSALIVVGLVASASPLLAALDLSKLPPAAKQDGVTYSKDIRPMFEASCLRCHGADRPKAGLRLDSVEAVLKGSKEGKVVVPGQSTKSSLVIAAARLDPETAMPPKPKQRGSRGVGQPTATKDGGTNQPAGRPPGPPPAKPLTAEQVGLVRAWVDQGAK